MFYGDILGFADFVSQQSSSHKLGPGVCPSFFPSVHIFVCQSAKMIHIDITQPSNPILDLGHLS